MQLACACNQYRVRRLKRSIAFGAVQANYFLATEQLLYHMLSSHVCDMMTTLWHLAQKLLAWIQLDKVASQLAN